ncbi:hypothetical protein ACFRFL_45270 [Streptomyces sp. NPDC056708]|uniref:hypothetical protein n=1 Tax=unclassified Streptomyces TaxID=2593676 RepID=UPI00369C911B
MDAAAAGLVPEVADEGDDAPDDQDVDQSRGSVEQGGEEAEPGLPFDRIVAAQQGQRIEHEDQHQEIAWEGDGGRQ